MFVSSKPDLSMALNGILAGLVGITAGADVVTPGSAITIGLVAGALVVGSVIAFDKLKVDDPVGATSVHLVCGVWGTLAVGLFSTNPEHHLSTQLIGVAVYGGPPWQLPSSCSERSSSRSVCASNRRKSSRD
jgi:ammonium transporter, Amt family